MRDYYYILGIEPSASEQEIKSAYRKLSKKFHPDNNNGDDFFKQHFQEINNAFQILIDPVKRSEYDRVNGTYVFKESASNKRTNNFGMVPIINFFRTNKKEILSGEEVTFKWSTDYSHDVMITPFGTVKNSGTKIYKVNNFNKEYLIFKIVAKNKYGSSEKEIYVVNKLVKNYITDPENALVIQASKWLRLFNFLIDLIAVFIGSIFAVFFVNGNLNGISDNEWKTINFFIYIGYYWFFESQYGRTLGKVLTGTKVVSIEGKEPESINILGRTISRLIPFEVFSNFGNAWHDTLSKTTVVKNKHYK